MTDPDSGRDALEELADEFAARHRRGERPTLTEYARKYPELADEILELFPALLVLEEIRPSASPTARGGGGGGGFPLRQLGEYRIVREIGRGGMGVVYEAEQESLGRRVALKVLPPGTLGHPRQVERFHREARTAARLHHTNLVPLFGVGEEGGTHYYVMQYIDGRPLDEVLVELLRLIGGPSSSRSALPPPRREPDAPEGEEAPPSDGNASSAEVALSLWKGRFQAAPRPGSSDLALAGKAVCRDLDLESEPEPDASRPASRALRGPAGRSAGPHRVYARSVAHLGVQVADALAYAAGQGVLHRDVKPSNLLLDMSGTVWLTDFGLAKATGAPDLTHTGDLFGTLRYMAPERFDGRADVRSDVYALGLTLYELLALRPAFDDRGQAPLVRQIAMSEPTRLDEQGRTWPRDLVTIVHKAMAKEPTDRYQTPEALAEDLRRFLDGRTILARRPSLAERAGRWCRRNPAMAGLAATVLVLSALAIGSGLREQQQRAERKLEEARREGQARQAVEMALDRAVGLQRQGLWTEAGSVLANAASRLDDAGSEDLRRRLNRTRGDLDLVAKLEAKRMGRVGPFGRSQPDAGTAARGYAEAFKGAGLPVQGDAAEATVAAQIRMSGAQGPLVAALDDWSLVTNDPALRARLLRIARLADPDLDWRDRVRDPAVWGDLPALERLKDEALEATETTQPPHLLTTLSVLIAEAGGDPEPLLRAAQRRHPGDFWLNFELARLLRPRKPAEALGFCRAALVVRPRSAGVYNLLGLTLWEDRRLEEAGEAFRRALELDPRLSAAHTNLGLVLSAEGRTAEAIAAHRRATEIDPGGGLGYANLAEVLESEGRIEESIAAYRKAIELDPKLANAYQRLRDLLIAEGRGDESAELRDRALDVTPHDAQDYHNLGNTLKVEGRMVEAIAAYRRAIQLDPRFALAREALGETLLREDRFAEARAEAQAWVDHLKADDPSFSRAQQHLRDCERRLALDAKLAAILEAKELPTDAGELRELAAFCLFYKHRFADAARLFAAEFALEPKRGDDLGAADRYNAACASALAASGQGVDADRLGEPERAALRRQTLDWLRADLVLWNKLVAEGPKGRRWGWSRQSLRHWQIDSDLVVIRDAAALANLPAEEVRACEALWEEVNTLLTTLRNRPDPDAAETPGALPQGGAPRIASDKD